MELTLQAGLPHQSLPIEALRDAFYGVNFKTPDKSYSNPILYEGQVGHNVYTIQRNPVNNIHANYRNPIIESNDPLILDFKMETGTGKTYVYTHAIFKLHELCGIRKFIIVVPSIAIKSGTRNFINEAYVRQHFSSVLGYNAHIELSVLTAQKKQKKGRRFFPNEVRKFVEGSQHNTQTIQVLIVNQQLLTTGKMLTRTDYDGGSYDFYRPFDALKATRPFVIIDEPHRFARDQKAFQTIVNELAPQCILRFGATFPQRTFGKGKSKSTRPDYAYLLYVLSAKDAFNERLIKGVAKEHFEPPTKKEEKIKILHIDKIYAERKVTVQHITSQRSVSHTMRVGDSFALLSPDMTGVSIIGITKDSILLSNGQEKRIGEEFLVDIYSQSYQEQMLRLALQRHFETERENFKKDNRIKTLALFFIDGVDSFRGGAEDKSRPWLRTMFEELLAEQLDRELAKSNSAEYSDFLRYSRENLADCIAGYFSQDNSDSDEAIAKEVDDILNNKKTLLSFRDDKGNWVVRRFLFSKWTLREGWDNPNVFTIAKLRTSGSEISKIQEVGRGLRLPVDEHGYRCEGQFMLNYIVDFSERNFADLLVSEINNNSEVKLDKIPVEAMSHLAELRGISQIDLLKEMMDKHFIKDLDRTVDQSHLFELFEEYPELNEIALGRVIDRNKNVKKAIKVRKARFEELKELWSELNKRYLIFIDKEIDALIAKELPEILADRVFMYQSVGSVRSVVRVEKDGLAKVVNDPGIELLLTASGRKISYRDFLLRINKVTSIPLKTVHNAIVEYFKDHEFHDDYINEASLSAFVARFNEWKAENLQGRFNYKSTGFTPKQTSLTKSDGTVVDEIAQGLIGVHLDKGTPSEKYLYDAIAYDSPLERSNILAGITEVIVYGKIPRSSISIPTIADSSYSPDFMYVVKKADGQKELNIVVETKDVENKNQLRGNELIKISCAEKFFEQLKIDGYTVHFEKQLNNRRMIDIISEYVN